VRRCFRGKESAGGRGGAGANTEGRRFGSAPCRSSAATVSAAPWYTCRLFLYVCMYVCMCVCMHACMYVCMYLSMYFCMYACTCVLY